MLEIKHLSAGVLSDINMTVEAGARHLLRGANGSGKTTLAQAIIGNPDYEIKSGRIIFNGDDITSMPTDARARGGIFSGAQNAPEIAGLSVMTFLKHSFIAHKGQVSMSTFLERLRAAQARLGIPNSWLGRSINVGFSGGERKRLIFLHLLLISPKFAILDEPDSGADKDTQKLFGEIIDEMRNTTFLIISHLDIFFKPTAETALQDGKIMTQ